MAREYTGKWLHRQHIRDAVGKPGLMTKAFFQPFISTFMLALPYTYRNVMATEGAVMQITITTEIGDTWFLLRNNDHWHLTMDYSKPADAQLLLEPAIAWQLFSKSISPEQVKDKIITSGNM